MLFLWINELYIHSGILEMVNSEQFGVGCKTADEINLDFLCTIFEQYHQFIRFPVSEQEIQAAMANMESFHKYRKWQELLMVFTSKYNLLMMVLMTIFAERGIIVPFCRQL